MNCSRCPGVRPIVHSIGPTPARVLFLGEQPSWEEDKTGEPFRGKTGFEFTDTYLVLTGLPRSEVHIDNARRCSTYDYSNPEKEDALSCCNLHLGPLLDRVHPQVVVPMGAIACSLWPEINLTLHHGRPMPGKWGGHEFILWPTFHPSAGIHGTSYMIPLMADFDGLRKLLLSLDQGTFEWPVDPYPEPDYRVIRHRDDLSEYMGELPDGSNVIACDTESVPTKVGSFHGAPVVNPYGDPFCVTFSHTPGTGRLIYVEDDPLLTIFRGTVAVGRPHLIFHNYLHDVQVFDQLSIPIYDFTDTMVRAYNLCLGGGGDDEDTESRAGRGSLSLKILAYRHLNVTMTSFRDTVYPHSIPLMLDWLQKVESTFRPYDPPPTCSCGHLTTHHAIKGKRLAPSGPCSLCACKRHKKADSKLTDEERKWNLLHRKTGNLIGALQNKQLADEYEELDLELDSDDAYPFVDPWKRIRSWHDHDKQFLKDYMEPWPLASVEHVPEPELLKYACLAGDSLVQTENGLRKIKELVSEKYSGCVFGVHPKTNTIVKRKVTGWHRFNHKEHVHWLSVRTEHSGLGRWGLMATRFTPDHKLMTSRGMVAVSDLVIGDSLYLPYERLTENQLQVTLGSLLGDGCLHHKNEKTGWCYLTVSHAHKQKPYLDWKKYLMGDLVSSEGSTPAGPKNSVMGGQPIMSSKHFNFNTSMHPEFLNYRKHSYGPGRRIGDWIKDIDGLGLAVCYQDNGTLAGNTARIYLLRFDAESVDLFRSVLLNNFGIDTTRYWCHRGGWAIHVRAVSSFKFFSLIQEHVHPCTQYKLPEEFRGKFIPATSDCSRGMFTSKVVELIETPFVGQRGSVKTSYCIDVDEIHNFLTSYEVAKNCRDADTTLRLYLLFRDLKPWLFY